MLLAVISVLQYRNYLFLHLIIVCPGTQSPLHHYLVPPSSAALSLTVSIWRVTPGGNREVKNAESALPSSTLLKAMMLAAVYPQKHLSRLKLHPHTVKCQWWHLLVCLFMVYIERNSAGWTQMSVLMGWSSKLTSPFRHLPPIFAYLLWTWFGGLKGGSFLQFFTSLRIDKSLGIYLFGGGGGNCIYLPRNLHLDCFVLF